MVNVGYTLGIPATNNNPSTDQPNMLINNDAVNTILGVDHVAFNAANGGTHNQVTFSSENTPGSQTDPASTLYTGPGSAVAHAQLLYKNQDGIFPASCIRAFGVFTNAAVVTTLDNSYNIASISGPVSRNYTITLNPNVVTGNNVCVLTNCSNGNLLVFWSFAAGVLTLTVGSGPGTKIAFAILQF